MPAVESNLRQVSRHITTNDDSGGSIFSSISADPPSNSTPDGMKITFCYGTDQIPAKIAGEQDLASYKDMIENPPPIVIPTGTAFRLVDFPPNYTSRMHRTLSVNFNVVIEGQVEFILENGEKRVLDRGDSIIQRYVSHAWRNTSQTEWVRIVAVPIPAEPVEFRSQTGNIKDVEIYTERLDGKN